MNILFLDFDGVLNTPLPDGKHINMGVELLNNRQAVSFISNFCLNYDYTIVVSSSLCYKGLSYCRTMLYSSGLNLGVGVLATITATDNKALAIKKYINGNPDIVNFIILDDDTSLYKEFPNELVLCNGIVGLTLVEYNKMTELAIKEF